MAIDGFYITIPILGVCLLIITILLICIIYEIHQSKTCSKKKNHRQSRRNNRGAKALIIFVTLVLILSADIGNLNDLIHVTYCMLGSNVQCVRDDNYNRMIADIAYFIAYVAFYFVIISRLYITFINTRYRLSPCSMFILFIITLICYGSCGSMLLLGYFNLDNEYDSWSTLSLISFLAFDFMLNSMVLVLFIKKMNKVIVNKTYRLPTEDLDDGTGFNNTNHNQEEIFNATTPEEIHYKTQSNLSDIDNRTHSFSFDNFPDAAEHSTDANQYDDYGLSWSVMDNKQVTLTTIVTRLTLLTLLAIFCNLLFALFLVYYYLYTYLSEKSHGELPHDDENRRDYGVTYCGRATIAALNALLTLLNFNFCHRKYYKCCKCCHKTLFRCFVRRNSKHIKGLSMHLGLQTSGDTNYTNNTGYKTIRFSMNNSIGKLSSASVFDSTASTEFDYFSD